MKFNRSFNENGHNPSPKVNTKADSLIRFFPNNNIYF